MSETRRAGAGDAAELMRLRHVMLASMHPGAVTAGSWLSAGVPVLERLLGDPAEPLAAFVVDRPDEPGLAACVVGAVDQRLPGPRDSSGLRGYVYNVATDPRYRRRGYSRACLTALLDWYAGRGITAVDLRASAEGEPLYAALGFVRTEDHPGMRLIIPAR
ncbi:GNAT family N-acetyltransferase [Actinoplanes sp. NPDC049599]|uniref:GNAT family N-acetyltransferase n=1 Tax=Actinoplanes sp. NPDC049599 TaxID=3363903 RepID=UPI0037ABA3BD